MKIVLLGATGFIGSALLNSKITGSDQCICLIRNESGREKLKAHPDVNVVLSDMTEDGLTGDLKDADIVIDMAGQMGGPGISEEDMVKGNVDLTENVVAACKRAGVKQLIYLSTPGVQGFGHRLCDEKEDYAPRNAYERTKVRAEEIIIKELSDADTAYTIIRPDFVYGPGDYRRVKLYKNIRDKKFVLTTSGKSYLHPTYVDDVAAGIRLCIGNEKAYDEIFNISAGNDITVKEYLQTIADHFNVKLVHMNIGYHLSIFAASVLEGIFSLFGKEAFVTRNKIDFLAIDHSTSVDKARKILGYDPKYDLKSGFEKTMEWIDKEGLM